MQSIGMLGVVLWLSGVAAGVTNGTATMPLSTWEAMRTERDAALVPERAPVAVVWLERKVEGALKRGLFSATLTARFQVLDAESGQVRVPLLDAATSVGDVRINGQRTSLLREGAMYTLGVDRPGVYTVQAQFYSGREQDRFARRVRVALPDGGITQLRVTIPETDIEPRLSAGVLVAERSQGASTVLEGAIDAGGIIDLGWSRRVSHRSMAQVAMEAKLSALFTTHEAVTEGTAAFDLSIRDGETDRIDLRLPADVEVVGVDGDAVLQWYTDATAGGRLVVLLRYLLSGETRLLVHFQFPTEVQKPTVLRLPLPGVGVSFTGVLGVQAPAGLEVKVQNVAEAETVSVTDLPAELTDLTTSPIVHGFSFTAAPTITVALERLTTVELLSTLIDEVQASSVLLADGVEITKLKLRMRNNTRQYVKLVLPKGALLTHSLIDGQSVRPAVVVQGGDEALLLPLRQSERVDVAHGRRHVVAAGDTLSGLANFYYSDPNAYQPIVDSNPNDLGGGTELLVGQELVIPAKSGGMQETSFVIELAYRNQHSALGVAGTTSLALPSLDVEGMQVLWHLYLPSDVSPLRFAGNLTQYDNLRYDPFRRVRDFLLQSLWIRDAWAGGRYQNILSQRKVIYRSEAGLKDEGQMVLSNFPLVGERYRFRRVLLSREQSVISVTYAATWVTTGSRWLSFVITLGLAWLLLQGRRTPVLYAAMALWCVVGLIAAYYVLGSHRRMLWAVDLALLMWLVQLSGRDLVAKLGTFIATPWQFLSLISLRSVGLVGLVLVWLTLVVLFPLLLSSLTLLLLVVAARRQAQRQEVARG